MSAASTRAASSSDACVHDAGILANSSTPNTGIRERCSRSPLISCGSFRCACTWVGVAPACKRPTARSRCGTTRPHQGEGGSRSSSSYEAGGWAVLRLGWVGQVRAGQFYILGGGSGAGCGQGSFTSWQGNFTSWVGDRGFGQGGDWRVACTALAVLGSLDWRVGNANRMWPPGWRAGGGAGGPDCAERRPEAERSRSDVRPGRRRSGLTPAQWAMGNAYRCTSLFGRVNWPLLSLRERYLHEPATTTERQRHGTRRTHDLRSPTLATLFTFSTP